MNSRLVYSCWATKISAMVKSPKQMSSLTGLIVVGAVEEVTVVKLAFAVEERGSNKGSSIS